MMQPAQPFRSLRRLGCGCLVMVILLMVLGGCAVGFGLSHLWALCDAAGAAVVRLSDVVSERASDGDGEFVVSEVTFEYSGGEGWLSGMPNGTGELQTDDKAVLVVQHADGSVAHWEHEFASADGTEVLPLAAVDVSGLFEVGQNQVTLRLSDLRSPALSSTAYYLVGRRNDEDVRATRVKYESTQSATATKTPTPTQTPTVVASPAVAFSAPSPNPTVVATPTVVASPTVVSRRVPFPTAVPNPTAVASPTAMATVTAVVSPTVTVGLGEQGTVSSGGSQGLLLPFGSVALLLLVGGVVWGRRKKEEPVVLGGWLEGYDDETGEMLPLVSLSDYGREALILRQPLRLITPDEFVGEELVVARIEAGDDGIGRVTVGFDEESIELGFETRLEIGSLVLDLRSESVGDCPMSGFGSWGISAPFPRKSDKDLR